jgi:hypothetical protein
MVDFDHKVRYIKDIRVGGSYEKVLGKESQSDSGNVPDIGGNRSCPDIPGLLWADDAGF